MIKSLDQLEIRPTSQTVESLGEGVSEIPVNVKSVQYVDPQKVGTMPVFSEESWSLKTSNMIDLWQPLPY